MYRILIKNALTWGIGEEFLTKIYQNCVYEIFSKRWPKNLVYASIYFLIYTHLNYNRLEKKHTTTNPKFYHLKYYEQNIATFFILVICNDSQMTQCLLPLILTSATHKHIMSSVFC